MNENNRIEALESSAQKNDLLIKIIDVDTDRTRSFKEIIMAGTPDTYKKSQILSDELAKKYPIDNSAPKRKLIEKVVIVNSLSGELNFDQALDWARSNELNRTDLYTICSVSESLPDLNRKLGHPAIFLIETTGILHYEGLPSAGSIYWEGRSRKYYLSLQDRYNKFIHFFTFTI